MDRINLKERIKAGLFLLDGAMGTQLFERGIEAGKCNDYLNIESEDIVFDVQNAYIKAGSDAIITNTFGANKYVLGRHGFGEQVSRINKAGAQIARRAAGEQRYVLGGLGPCGDFLEPLGTLKAEDLRHAFAQQANALLAEGVDGFIIETMTAIEEIVIAIEAIKSVCELPILASMAFDKTSGGFRTMMGVDVDTAAAKIIPLGIDAIGFNCGTASLTDYVELANNYVAAAKALQPEITILAEMNAGLPELVDGNAVYNISPEDFAAAAEKLHLAGINIIGGCCGTSPEHIKAVAENLLNGRCND